MIKYYITLFFVLIFIKINAQTVVIKGKILDSETHEPVPFASISLKKTSFGVITDFEGNFSFNAVTTTSDSTLITCMGYKPKTIALLRDSLNAIIPLQTLEIFLNPAAVQLREVVIHGGENPAWKILRKVVEKRDENNYKKLSGYEHSSYNKIEVDLSRISKTIAKTGIAKSVNKAIDKIGTLTDDNNNKVIPVFISESQSKYFFRKNPRLSRENIIKTNIKGVAITDGSLTSQLIGSTFQQYNFYENQVSVLDKNFTSPIGNDWKTAYDYYLADSLWVGDDFCYAIEFSPKHKYDLVFSGEMWISKKHDALVQIDATITKDANLNFIEKIKIQQELDPFEDVFFPIKNRVIVDVAEVTNNSSGMFLKFSNFNQEIEINNPRDTKFFDKSVDLAVDFKEENINYWQKIRPEPLSDKEIMAYKMIDTIRNVPSIRRITSLINIASTGYAPLFPWADLGPVVYSASINDYEGLRLRFGMRTNVKFSRDWVLQGYLAAGTKDQKLKGGGEVTRILSRDPWTTFNLRYKHDLEQVGLRPDDAGVGSLYSAMVRFGNLRKPFYENELRGIFEREVSKGVLAKFGLRGRSFNPVFDFGYYLNTGDVGTSNLFKTFRTTEMLAEVVIAKDQVAILSDNERLNFGTLRSPTITFRYSGSFKNFMNSDFTFHNLSLQIKHTLNLGYYGKTFYRIEAGRVFGNVPYPLLKNHLGNETIFAFNNTFNLMKQDEFVSDQYASLRIFHDFEGLFFNRIPLIKKLKWRTFVTGNLLYGNLSDANKSLTTNAIDLKGLSPGRPYTEIGYGINNIFRFISIQAIHRLDYLDVPNVKKFGVKVTAELSL